MKRYEYKVVKIDVNIWKTGRPEVDYLDVINEQGAIGWRFIEIIPGQVPKKNPKGIELLFEREIED